MTHSTFKPSGIITLTTDFGVSDPYAGVLKGVILARHPCAGVIDLTHRIPAFQPRLAGFWLARVAGYFPAGTVHLAVVDPGVGTERAMAAVLTQEQAFIAPDNGLLDEVFLDAVQKQAAAQWRRFTLADLAHLRLPLPSRTFHGRDIFAPLVAEIAAGRQAPETLGELIAGPNKSALPLTQGVILWVDHYGNLLTSLTEADLQALQQPALWLGDQLIPVVASYGFAAVGSLIALVNSWGGVEIAVTQGNAQQRLQAQLGETVQLLESDHFAADA